MKIKTETNEISKYIKQTQVRVEDLGLQTIFVCKKNLNTGHLQDGRPIKKVGDNWIWDNGVKKGG